MRVWRPSSAGGNKRIHGNVVARQLIPEWSAVCRLGAGVAGLQGQRTKSRGNLGRGNGMTQKPWRTSQWVSVELFSQRKALGGGMLEHLSS